MNYLLDTHTFIWFINGDKSLPVDIIEKIRNVKNQCFFSVVGLWEIAIKVKLDKLQLKSDFKKISKFCLENEIEILPITFEHILELNKLEFHHRDPFDRLIIAQAITEDLTIISKDGNFVHYPVKCIW